MPIAPGIGMTRFERRTGAAVKNATISSVSSNGVSSLAAAIGEKISIWRRRMTSAWRRRPGELALSTEPHGGEASGGLKRGALLSVDIDAAAAIRQGRMAW